MEPLVLIPGFMSDGRVFLDQLTDLSKDRPVMVAKPVGQSVSEMAESVLDAAPPGFALAGHGLGAAVAAEMLRRAQTRVRRIALLAESPYRTAIRNHWIEMALEMGPDEYQTQSRIMQRRPDLQNVLRRARIPALVVGGAQDKLCPPRRQDFLAQLMPYAEFLEIPTAGHLPMLEAPQTISAALIAWLEADPPLLLR